MALRALFGTAASALVLLAGCTSLNEGRLIGGVVAIDSVTPEVERADREWQPVSVVSLDRSNWQEIEFLVPLDAVEHYPTYTQEPNLLWQTARQRGDYPTAETALDTETVDMFDEQALELLAAPASALVDIAMFPARAIAGVFGDEWWGGHPLEVVASPLEPYERAPGRPLEAPGRDEDAADAEEAGNEGAPPRGWPWEETPPEPAKPAPPPRPSLEVGG